MTAHITQKKKKMNRQAGSGRLGKKKTEIGQQFTEISQSGLLKEKKSDN